MTAAEHLRSRLKNTATFLVFLVTIYIAIWICAEWRAEHQLHPAPVDSSLTWCLIGLAFFRGLYEKLFPTFLPHDRAVRFARNQRQLIKSYIRFAERVQDHLLEHLWLPTKYGAVWYQPISDIELDPDVQSYLRGHRWSLVLPASAILLFLLVTT